MFVSCLSIDLASSLSWDPSNTAEQIKSTILSGSEPKIESLLSFELERYSRHVLMLWFKRVTILITQHWAKSCKVSEIFIYRSTVQLDLITIGFSAVFSLFGIWMLFFSSVDDDDDLGGGGLGSPVYEPVYSVNPA